MSDKLVDFVAKQTHVALVTGTAIQPLSGFDSITGLDLNQFSRMSGGFHFLEGGPFTSDQDILIDEYYAQEKRLHVGDKLQLINHEWRVAGIFESGKLARICVRLPVLQRLMVNEHHLSQIYVKADSPDHIQEVLGELRARMPGYPIYTMEEFTSLLSINSVGLLRNFIGVVIGVAVIVGFIVVFMAMYTAVLERTREIGILKAVGASSGFILDLLFRGDLVALDPWINCRHFAHVRDSMAHAARGPGQLDTGDGVPLVANRRGDCHPRRFARGHCPRRQSRPTRCDRGAHL